MTTYGEERLHELAKRLLIASKSPNSTIEWHESDRNTAFHCSVGDATVVIASVDGDGRHPYSLEVLDSEGALLDSLKSGTYHDENGEWNCDWNTDLETLYDRAHRRVKNIDAVLDSIMNALPDLPKSGGFSDDPPF
jgi:hypothetical protein